MRNILLLLVIVSGLMSCNRESIRISGELKGFEDSKVDLRFETKAGFDKLIAADLKVEDGEFEVYIENEKPPFKLTVVIDSLRQIDFWVFKYGKLCFELDASNLSEVKIHDCFENTELARVNKTYNKMYLKPLRKEIDWVTSFESVEHENVDEADEAKLERYKAQIKNAYRLRKKSILKTIRKAPQNPISMALFFDGFESLTKWQKKECLKLAQKYYSDTGMNWQLKH